MVFPLPFFLSSLCLLPVSFQVLFVRHFLLIRRGGRGRRRDGDSGGFWWCSEVVLVFGWVLFEGMRGGMRVSGFVPLLWSKNGLKRAENGRVAVDFELERKRDSAGGRSAEVVNVFAGAVFEEAGAPALEAAFFEDTYGGGVSGVDSGPDEGAGFGLE